MAETTFIKNFEDWKGLDLKSSPLTRNPNFALDLKNYQFGEGFSLEGREGYQVIGQAGNFLGIHNYSYASRQDGSTVEELLAINDHLWRLKTYYLRITRVAGSTTWGYRVYLDTTSGTFKFEITQTGAATFTQDVESGLGTDAYTVFQLSAAIDALANFTCSVVETSGTAAKTARVNGAMSGVSTFTVDAGHNYVAGDIVTFYDSAAGKLSYRLLSSVTATTLTWSSDYGVASAIDNLPLGPSAAVAAGIPLTNGSQSQSTSVADVSFYNWSPIFYDNRLGERDKGPFSDLWTARTRTDFSPPCFINSGDSCYIATMVSEAVSEGSPYGWVYRYDGVGIARAGSPRHQGLYVEALSAGALTGNYTWLGTFVYKDANGVEWESRAIEIATKAMTAQRYSMDMWNLQILAPNEAQISAITAATNTMTVTAGHRFSVGDYCYFWNSATSTYIARKVTAIQTQSITFNGAVASVTTAVPGVHKVRFGFNLRGANVSVLPATNLSTITVDAGHTVVVGDWVWINDVTSGVTKSVKINAITATTIGWDATKYGSMNAGVQWVSVGYCLRIYRTKNGGATFYKVGESPLGESISTQLIDNTADTALGEAFDFPLPGSEPYLLPRAKFLCLHQGCLILAGDYENPNTVSIALPGEPEFYPAGSGAFDIAPTITGPVTAIASDSQDSLAVFKANAYYDVQGDITTPGAYSIRTVTEGDYGISSHASISKVKGLLIGVGLLGIIAIRDGQLITEPGDLISPAFIGNTNISFSKAIACNDWSRRHYSIYIPDLTANQITNSLSFISAYNDKGQWFNWHYSLGQEPSGGSIVHDERNYHLSRSLNGTTVAKAGNVFRSLKVEELGAFAYVDNAVAISYNIEPQWIHLNEPSIDKQIVQIRAYSIVSSYEVFVPFTLNGSTYRNFQTATFDSVFSMPFSSSSTFSIIKDLKPTAVKSLLLRLESVAYNQRPFITGIEYVLRGSYKKESFLP